jgi:hypothetical protein
MWICRFSRNTVAGRLRPPIASSAAESFEPTRCELGPTRIIRAHSLPLAILSVTLEAPNRRAVVSAICCKDCSASPDAPAIARRISALAFWRSRAMASSPCSRAFSCANSACLAVASSRSARLDSSRDCISAMADSSSSIARLKSTDTSSGSAAIQSIQLPQPSWQGLTQDGASRPFLMVSDYSTPAPSEPAFSRGFCPAKGLKLKLYKASRARP